MIKIKTYPGKTKLLAAIACACTSLPGWTDETALKLLERAQARIGSVADIERAGGIILEGEGLVDLSARLQGKRPAREEPGERRERLVFDPANDRLLYLRYSQVNPDAFQTVEQFFTADGFERIALPKRRLGFWRGDDGVADRKRRYARVIPHVLLDELIRQPDRVEVVQRRKTRGVVVARLESGARVELVFEPETALLLSARTEVDLAVLGRTEVRFLYGDWHKVGRGLLMPRNLTIQRGERTLKEVRYKSVTLGVDDSEFAIPFGVGISDRPGGPDTFDEDWANPDVELDMVADGVWLARNVRPEFHPLIVRFDDFVAVVDAPAGFFDMDALPPFNLAGDEPASAPGERLMAAVKRAAPGKDVRFLVLTHWHGDQTGGMTPFLKAGATVVAAPAAALVTKYMAEDQKLGAPSLLEVRGRVTLSDGTRKMTVLNVGDNPHSEGMLVVYLDEEKLLYQADLFYPSAYNFPNPDRVPVMKWFAHWLDKCDLDVDQVLSAHGTGRVTPEQLRQMR